MNTLIAIDTETGGLIPGVHALLSIGAISESGATFSAYIKPSPYLRIDPEAAKVNGYTPELWEKKDAVSLREAMVAFHFFLDVEKLAHGNKITPLAHNAGFDRGFIDWGIATADFLPRPLPYRWECSQAAFAFIQRAGLHPSTSASLDALCAASGYTRRPQVHDALEDAKACLHGYAWLSQLASLRIG